MLPRLHSLAVAAIGYCLAASVNLPLTTAQPGTHVPGSLPRNQSEPLQHRLAYAGTNGNAMSVQFNTYGWIGTPRVYYGLQNSVSAMTMQAAGTSATYNTSLTYTHTVVVQNLQPYTTYWYYVSNTNCSQCQQLPLYSFTTALPAGSMQPFSMGIVGDMGLMGVPESVTTAIGTYPVAGLANYGPGNPSSSSNENPAPVPPAIAPSHTTMMSINDSVISGQIDFLVHIGDIAYADYIYKILPKNFTDLSLTSYEEKLAGAQLYEAILEAYFDEIQPFSSQVPYMVLPGNHDATCDNGHASGPDSCFPGQLNFTAYNVRWNMPSVTSGGVDNMWYSFNYGMTHFLVYDTETAFDWAPDFFGGYENFCGSTNDPNCQGPFIEPSANNYYLQWMENDLRSVDRTVTPWVIALGHRPYYTSNSEHCTACQSAFEALFNRYQVDMVQNGHIHLYERLSPISYGAAIDPSAYNDPISPVYIVNGGGGHYSGQDYDDEPLGYGSLGNGSPFQADTQFAPYSRYFNDQLYGWGYLTFLNATHLTWNFVNSANNTVMDSITLYKSHVPNQIVIPQRVAANSTLARNAPVFSANYSAAAQAAAAAAEANFASYFHGSNVTGQTNYLY